MALMMWACGSDGSSRARPDREEARVAETAANSQYRAVLFLGTSLTAGLGVAESESYPAIIARRIDSLGAPLRVVNAGESGGTSAGGLRRIDFLLEQNDVAVLVLELGANDGLRGLSVDAMRANLDGIIARTVAAYPDVDVVVAGMEAPPNLGEPYTTMFREAFGEIAREHDALLIPFLLESVGGVPEMNQDDGIHPNAAGHRRVADNVWTVLEDVVERRMANASEG